MGWNLRSVIRLTANDPLIVTIFTIFTNVIGRSHWAHFWLWRYDDGTSIRFSYGNATQCVNAPDLFTLIEGIVAIMMSVWFKFAVQYLGFGVDDVFARKPIMVLLARELIREIF